MSDAAPLLIEIGCEEIPARMIRAAAADLGRRVVELLQQAGLGHGEVAAWGGPRRLAVRVESVQARQADREEQVLGPPAKVAFDDSGTPTKAAVGFARKQGIDPAELSAVETKRGQYVGFVRQVVGRDVGAVLADVLPPSVAAMSFPKTMRWSDGKSRWVRPVHWLLALHGDRRLDLELFGVRSAGSSVGHRFRSDGAVVVGHPDEYFSALEAAHVLVDPAARRARIETALRAAAAEQGGELVEDAALLDEVADIVEWPGVVAGGFDEKFLDLPRELTVTTLRHHQKCFSVRSAAGKPLPFFLAVANTDADPAGHVRRGNEWVVGGRLEDARFFWREDRKRELAERSADLDRVVFHAKVGSYADKAGRLERLAGEIGAALGLDETTIANCRSAAKWAKNDLVTGTVGEFPELQGCIGGLMLAAEGGAQGIADGVYSHYQPSGPDDDVPATDEGCVVSVADKLDSVVQLIAAGETPSGSRDPLGLRRAGAGIVRILHEREWKLSLEVLFDLTGQSQAVLDFLQQRLTGYLRDLGYTPNEILAVLRPRISEFEALTWSVSDIVARLTAITRVRGREDFVNLVKLTQRVDNILTKDAGALHEILDRADEAASYSEDKPAAVALGEMVERNTPEMAASAERRCYDEIVERLSGFIDPVEKFFDEVLVIDADDPQATLHRRELLGRLRNVLTRYFDIRELAGQAERRAT